MHDSQTIQVQESNIEVLLNSLQFGIGYSSYCGGKMSTPLPSILVGFPKQPPPPLSTIFFNTLIMWIIDQLTSKVESGSLRSGVRELVTLCILKTPSKTTKITNQSKSVSEDLRVR